MEPSCTLKLRQGVKWHDGKPLTVADVKWMLMDTASEASRNDSAQGRVAESTRSARAAGGHLSPEAAAAGVSDGAR
jgi:ABC-type transport system substrate-binding protein